MSDGANPNDERFDHVESVLNQLSNSPRHLLHAQVLMNDLRSKTESFVERIAEENLKTAEGLRLLSEDLRQLSGQVQVLADGQSTAMPESTPWRTWSGI
jgi:predicted metal-dependent enzyme (double-stranded beta helix superfamily)